MANPKTYKTISRLYDLLDLPFEHLRYRPIRRRLWRNLEGRILDAGVGTGRNIAHYPCGARIVGVDLSPGMLKRAEARRDRLGRTVELCQMDICETGFESAGFDHIVSSFLFCVLDDELQLPALRELRRLCRAGGEIRILEYAYSKQPVRRFVMKLWAPWVAFAYGARFDRDTEQYAEAAGLELISAEFVHGDMIKLLVLRPAK